MIDTRYVYAFFLYCWLIHCSHVSSKNCLNAICSIASFSLVIVINNWISHLIIVHWRGIAIHLYSSGVRVMLSDYSPHFLWVRVLSSLTSISLSICTEQRPSIIFLHCSRHKADFLLHPVWPQLFHFYLSIPPSTISRVSSFLPLAPLHQVLSVLNYHWCFCIFAIF